jgi:hypothetical protein
MVSKSNWQKMKAHADQAFSRDGGISVEELGNIVAIGCADGALDEYEKVVLISIISSLTGADMNAAMWAKVDELIEKYDLHQDSEATIEDLDDEVDENG